MNLFEVQCSSSGDYRRKPFMLDEKRSTVEKGPNQASILDMTGCFGIPTMIVSFPAFFITFIVIVYLLLAYEYCCLNIVNNQLLPQNGINI